MKSYQEIKPALQPLIARYQQILQQRAGHDSKAKEIEISFVKKYFKAHCLTMLLLPVLIVTLVVIGSFFGSGEGLIAGLFSGFALIPIISILLFGFLIYGVIKMVSASKEAKSKHEKADIKLDIMKPFLDIALDQKTEYLKRGTISQLISPKMMEQGMFKGIKPDDQLTDIIKARFGETEVIFGEKRIQRWVREKGGFEEAIGGVGRVIDFIDEEGGGYHTVTIDSLLMLVDFHKSFSGTVSIHSRAEEEGLVDKWHMRNREVMGDVRFDERFAVYSTDPTLARYILSPLMMERLLGLRERYRCGLRILFKDGDMLLQLDWNRNMLETDLRSFVSKFTKEYSVFGKKLTVNTWSSFDNIYPEDIKIDADAFEGHYADIASVYGLIDELRQNVRIWA